MIEPLPSEAELLRRSRRGDAEAFGKLVTHYQDAVYNVVIRMIRNPEDARELTQDVFLRAYRRIASFQGRSSLATWLYSIAVNHSISERRRRAAASRAPEIQMSALGGQDTDSAYDPPAAGPAPADRLNAAETHREIQRVLAELDDDYRSVIVLRDIEGLDYSAISDTLGCSRGTVKSRLHRARLQLRGKLRHLFAERGTP